MTNKNKREKINTNRGIHHKQEIQPRKTGSLLLLINIGMTEESDSLDVVCFFVILPLFVELMNLTSNIALLLQVKTLKYKKQT